MIATIHSPLVEDAVTFDELEEFGPELVETMGKLLELDKVDP